MYCFLYNPHWGLICDKKLQGFGSHYVFFLYSKESSTWHWDPLVFSKSNLWAAVLRFFWKVRVFLEFEELSDEHTLDKAVFERIAARLVDIYGSQTIDLVNTSKWESQGVLLITVTKRENFRDRERCWSWTVLVESRTKSLYNVKPCWAKNGLGPLLIFGKHALGFYLLVLFIYIYIFISPSFIHFSSSAAYPNSREWAISLALVHCPHKRLVSNTP